MAEYKNTKQLPLRERMREYLAFFGIGLLVCAIVGLAIAAISSYSFIGATAYTMITLGTFMLFSGGVAGGGYANIAAGAFGMLFGSETPRPQKSAVEDEEETDLDPREQLRRGLRPEANPQAFWQVVGGFTYLGLGAALVFRYL